MTKIYVKAEGRPGYFEAFTWTRSARAGLERAIAEAPRFGHTLIGAFAKDVASNTIVASWHVRHGFKAF
jgi:hypothetical protein